MDIADGNTDFTSPYVRTGNNDKICYVVIGGDRGLAGGYNSNLFKHFEAESKDKEKIVFPVGKKVVEYAQRRGYEIMSDQFSHIASVSVSDCFSIANLVCKEFNAGRFGHVALFYTKFVSMMSQTAGSFPILPLNDLTNHDEDAEERKKADERKLRRMFEKCPDHGAFFVSDVVAHGDVLGYRLFPKLVERGLLATTRKKTTHGRNMPAFIKAAATFE